MIQPITVVDAITHWGRETHICVGKLTIIGSDNGLSPRRRQAIIWTNSWILLIGPLGTNLSEILIKIQTFSFKKIRLKMSSAKCCPFRLGLNVIKGVYHDSHPSCCFAYTVEYISILETYRGRVTHITMRQQTKPSLVQIMACRLFGANPHPNQCWSMVRLTFRNNLEQIWVKIPTNISIQENEFDEIGWKRWQAFYLGQIVY